MRYSTIISSGSALLSSSNLRRQCHQLSFLSCFSKHLCISKFIILLSGFKEAFYGLFLKKYNSLFPRLCRSSHTSSYKILIYALLLALYISSFLYIITGIDRIYIKSFIVCTILSLYEIIIEYLINCFINNL